MQASPGCWAVYGQLVARASSGLASPVTRWHHVACYAVQHPMHGLMTVADSCPPTPQRKHVHLALRWGTQVWQAGKPHHATIRAWNSAVLRPS